MKVKLIIKLSSVVFFIFLGINLFVPKNYPVESFEERKGTAYWTLKTGSKIGYFKIAHQSEPKKTPIIYLHGGPGGIVSDQVIEVLTPLSNQGHDLYFYDQIGSGHSERLDNIGEYSVERHQKDLEAIVEKIGADKIILIAQSWGSLLAINYLENHVNQIEKIILTGPGSILPINRKMRSIVPPDSLSLREPETTNKEANEKMNTWRIKLITKWASLFNSKLASDQEVDNFFGHLNYELSKSTYCAIDQKKEKKKIKGGLGFYNHIMTINSFSKVKDQRNKLRKMTTPILIIRGQCDNQKWGFTKEYLDLFSNAKLEIIKDTGHDLIGGDKEKYFQLIENFLSNNQNLN